MKRSLGVEVLVIGGGATGAGVARDAAMRGFSTILVEAGELCSGTTGHFHGQLHSGARYVVNDPASALECVQESAVLRRIASGCVGDTGGFFVLLPGDDPAYPAAFLTGCRSASVAVEELDPLMALQREPHLNPALIRAFAVPDATLDARGLVQACALSAVNHGAQVMVRHRLVGLHLVAGEVAAADVLDAASGQSLTIEAGIVVNAAGAWADDVARLAGCTVPTRLGKGVMVAVPSQLVTRVLSRCRLPADGDILVPQDGALVIGTTDEAADGPGDTNPDPPSVARMLTCGAALVPGLATAGTVRAWAAVRPLLPDDRGEGGAGTRGVSRSHRLLDHGQREGVGRFLTISGGKATTFRLMAEHAVDAVCVALDAPRRSTTHLEPLPGLDAPL